MLSAPLPLFYYLSLFLSTYALKTLGCSPFFLVSAQTRLKPWSFTPQPFSLQGFAPHPFSLQGFAPHPTSL